MLDVGCTIRKTLIIHYFALQISNFEIGISDFEFQIYLTPAGRIYSGLINF